MTDDQNITDGGEVVASTEKIALGKPLLIFLIITSVFTAAIGVGLGFVLFTSRQTAPVATVLTQNSPAAEPVKPKEKSKLATDSAVLKLQSDINAFSQELDRLDLLEPQLSVPNIDLDIAIK